MVYPSNPIRGGQLNNDFSFIVSFVAFFLMQFCFVVLFYKSHSRNLDDKKALEDEKNKSHLDEMQKIIENAEKIIVSELIEANQNPGDASRESRIKELREIIDKTPRG